MTLKRLRKARDVWKLYFVGFSDKLCRNSWAGVLELGYSSHSYTVLKGIMVFPKYEYEYFFCNFTWTLDSD